MDQTTRKKALCIASVASNLDNFNRNNVEVLLDLGYDVTLAANFSTSEDTNSPEKVQSFQEEMEAKGVHIHQIDFSRYLAKISQQLRSVRQVKELLAEGFDLVHCNSPICSVITRACTKKYRKNGSTKVLYTAHGFHFFDGAPLKNWLLYYPVERRMSRYTDTLITINTEDYKRAKEKLQAERTEYVHGIGVDLARWNEKVDSDASETLRRELGISEDDIMLLSVGELNENKNHSLVLKAMELLRDPRLHYAIAGIGPQKEVLEKLEKEADLQDKLHLLGFRTDINDLCHAADLFILPSLREGLCVALMEAIACHTPVLAGKIRGNVDLIKNQESLFDPHKAEELAKCISRVVKNRKRNEIHLFFEAETRENYKILEGYDKETVKGSLKQIYGDLR